MIKPFSDVYLTFYYPELKQLVSTFLTLVSSIFTFSVIFAEKLSARRDHGTKGILLLGSAWVLFIIALILGGLGLLLIFNIADIIYGYQISSILNKDADGTFVTALTVLDIAGFCFVGGLIMLGVSALFKLHYAAPTERR